MADRESSETERHQLADDFFGSRDLGKIKIGGFRLRNTIFFTIQKRFYYLSKDYMNF